MKKVALVVVFVGTLFVGALTESDPTRSLVAASVLVLAMGLYDVGASLRGRGEQTAQRGPTAGL